MNTKSIKIFAVVVCSIIFISASFAQEKPQALKFDEFEEPSESSFTSYLEEPTLIQRAERFGKQFRKERGAKAYVIYYLGRVTENDLARQISYKIDRIESNIRAENDYSNDNVIAINGGYREKTAIEFWIAPKDAAPPKPTPTLDKSETIVCPTVSVYGDYLPSEPNTLRFSISAYNLREMSDYSLKWKVIGGEIVGDQTANKIEVKINDNGKRATAYAEIEGLPFPCPKVFSATATVKGKLQQIDEFGREPNGQIRSRLDSFLTDLLNNPTAQGYVIIYGSREGGKKYAIGREKLIRSHLAFRNIDTSRINYIDGGYREDVVTELWLSFDANQKPVPTPTVDAKFVSVPVVTKKSGRR